MQLRGARVTRVAHILHARDRAQRGDDFVRDLIERVQIGASQLQVDARQAATAEAAGAAQRTLHVGADRGARDVATDVSQLVHDLEDGPRALLLGHELHGEAGPPAAAARAEAAAAAARN